MNRHVFRWWLRGISVLFAVAMTWSSRFYLDPDGMSYVDLAKSYLRGDWHNALSSYWSPLYPWLLAGAFGAFHPDPEWLIPLTHGVCLLFFLATLASWEWLMREWEAWQGPPAHWLLVDTTAYLLITWTGLELAGVDFNSADDAVIALLIAASALLLRVRRGVVSDSDSVWLGVVLALGFFAKSAFVAVIPVVLLALWALTPGPKRWRATALAGSVAVVCLLPYVIPLSIAKGKPTLSDTGWVNYSWQVTGYGVEGYKEEAYPAPATIPHPIEHLLEKPRVIGYETHLVGTTPIHFDPAWWCQGYPRNVNFPRQWMVLQENVLEVWQEGWQAPAVWFALIVFPFGIGRVWAGIRATWFLWAPSAAMTAAFCAIFVLTRYTAAPFSMFGFAIIGAGWKVRIPKWALWIGMLLLITMSGFPRLGEPGSFSGTLWTEMHSGVWKDLREIAGNVRADDSFVIDAYHEIRKDGFRPGDRAGVIGLTLAVPYLELLEGQEVAAVPARIYHLDNEAGRPLDFTWEKVDEFWKASAADRERALAAMKKAGAKWVFASQTPASADVTGWTPVTKEKNQRDGRCQGVSVLASSLTVAQG